MIEYNDFRKSGFILVDVPDYILDYFKILSFQSKNNNLGIQKKLAGNLEEEYEIKIDDEKISKDFLTIISGLIYEYEKRYYYPNSIQVLDNNLPYKLGEMWVNYQKKYEFNPLHKHPGIFSYVIWINIPYNIEDELKNPSSSNSNYNVPSFFQFVYNDVYGTATHNIPIDKTYEGKMIIFPSFLQHVVYPFYTSDEYRISISGNICLETNVKT
jgi:hypothetical protein